MYRYLESVFNSGCILYSIMFYEHVISIVLLVLSCLNIMINLISKFIHKDLTASDIVNGVQDITKEVEAYEQKKSQDVHK